jgi:hypothetical protein
MNKAAGGSRNLDEYMGCFGSFQMEDPVCRTLCALRLRCAIERDQQDRMEVLEEIVSAEGISSTIH